MTEFTEAVEKRRLMIEAEEWAKLVENMHCHGLTSMWYETPESLEISKGKMVTDITYNDGHIERTIGGKLVYTFGEPLKGEELLDKYVKVGR